MVVNMNNYQVEIHSVRPASLEACPKGGVLVSWSAPNVGFGEWALYWGGDGKLHADTEYMDQGEDKEFTRAIMNALVDEIVIDS